MAAISPVLTLIPVGYCPASRAAWMRSPVEERVLPMRLTITSRLNRGCPRQFAVNWLRVLQIERTSCSKGTKLLHAPAVQQAHPGQKTLRSPTFCVRLCTGVLRIFLTTPLSYAAVAFSCGQYEKLLGCGKLATS